MTGLRDNRFAWFDLYVHDPVEASAFYTEVVGWGSQPFGERSNGYRMFMAGEKGVGGITKLSDDMKSRGEDPHWRAFVQVADVDATIKKARSLGAEVLSAPFDVPGVGRLSAFLDPQGVSLGVYAPKFPAIELEASPVPTGHFVWHEFAADDEGVC